MEMILFHKEEIETSLPARFERVVCKYPDRLAMKTSQDRLTYRELDNLSNRIAHSILSQHEATHAPIALLFEHGAAPISAILGVLKAGRCYVALDPSFPYARTLHILNETCSSLLITNRKNASFAAELIYNPIQSATIEDIATCFPDDRVSVNIAPHSPAAIFYTSGSTGKPKGIIWEHRQILHTVWNSTHTHQICAEDRQLLVSSTSFAGSVSHTFSALLNGACLYPYPVAEKGISRLAQRLLQEEITLLQLPIQLFRQFMSRVTDSQHFPKIRVIRLGGQILYKQDIKNVKQYFSKECVLVHGLSTTETSRITSFLIDQQTDMTWDVVPVGYAIEDKEILLLDETGKNVDVGHIGEIAVKSRYLSPGYWNDPGLTRQKFLPDPEGGDKRIYLTGDLGRMREDGCLEYLGRKDFQVKIRGYRVVLTEIESVLYALKTVKDAVVAAREQTSGDADLIAYVVPTQHPAPTVSELRRELAQVLPEYMLPARFVFLDALPLTSTGKVNRQALPHPEGKRPQLEAAYVAPRTEWENQVTTLCEDLLNIRPIGVEDNLFDLGLDSIQALRLFVEIENLVGRPVKTELLDRTVTIAQLTQLFVSDTPPLSSEGKVFAAVPHRSSQPRSRRRRLSYLEQLFLALRLPYSVGSKLLAWFCGFRWVQEHYFPQKQVSNMRAFLSIAEHSDSTTEILQQHLMSGFMRQWRANALARCHPSHLERWMEITGSSHIQQAQQSGLGIIILSSHFGPNVPTLLLFERWGFHKAMHLFWRGQTQGTGRKILTRKVYPQQELVSVVGTAGVAALYRAKQMLKQQGVVHLAPDGYMGSQAIELPFVGRRRPFRIGFAELAVLIEAVVLPIFTSINVSGHITVEVLPPLDTGTAAMTREDRVESLVRQYATLLEQYWRDDPGSIAAGQLRKFLKLPTIQGA